MTSLRNFFRCIVVCLASLLLVACATPKTYDYTAFRQSNPRSIVVLPPLNNSPDMHATYSFLSTVTQPLAEAGYYVFPVALVDQTFQENGLLNPGEMHQAPLDKIREIFGADAVLYITVTQYGPTYLLFSSQVIVTAQAKLIDTHTGQLLWDGAATASDSEGNNNSGGLAAMLITAVVKQIVSDVVGDGHSRKIATITSNRLLMPRSNGLPHGPRSPLYQP